MARSRVRWAQDAANREFGAVNAKTESHTELLRGVLRACAEMAESAARTLETLPVESNQARRRLVGDAQKRAEWALRRLTECRAFYDEARAEQPDPTVALVSSEDAPLELGEVTAPTLRLLPGGKR